jgi:tRNA(Ile2)-agmatinylcytidine synthase
MCTTYLGAVLAQRLRESGIRVTRAYLVRLNPNVPYKTRGNAAIALEAEGDSEEAFAISCRCVEHLADMEAENTHPGVVVTDKGPSESFYHQAVQNFCSLEETREILDESGSLYLGYKNGRGLIGATAAVASEFPDTTYEWLSYRFPERWGSVREVGHDGLRASQIATSPHTWDTVDLQNRVVVCVPHTPDPVLFGIRGESPFWVAQARGFIQSETPSCEMIYQTNQGTDAHLIPCLSGELIEGGSYLLSGRVTDHPLTREGGYVQVTISGTFGTVTCLAYEPTKGFRDVVRSLIPGDRVQVTGSYKRQSINLEKLCIEELSEDADIHPPFCPFCRKRMTSAGRNKGYKCRSCSARATNPEKYLRPRRMQPGWYEVPSCARRHLAKPLIRNR